MPVEPEPIATLPEAPATLGRDERRERRDHRRIPPGPIHERPVVRRPAHPTADRPAEPEGRCTVTRCVTTSRRSAGLRAFLR